MFIQRTKLDKYVKSVRPLYVLGSSSSPSLTVGAQEGRRFWFRQDLGRLTSGNDMASGAESAQKLWNPYEAVGPVSREEAA